MRYVWGNGNTGRQAEGEGGLYKTYMVSNMEHVFPLPLHSSTTAPIPASNNIGKIPLINLEITFPCEGADLHIIPVDPRSGYHVQVLSKRNVNCARTQQRSRNRGVLFPFVIIIIARRLPLRCALGRTDVEEKFEVRGIVLHIYDLVIRMDGEGRDKEKGRG